jgi:hypothetical protein
MNANSNESGSRSSSHSMFVNNDYCRKRDVYLESNTLCNKFKLEKKASVPTMLWKAVSYVVVEE